MKEHQYKRPFDIAISTLGLLLLSPLFVLFSFLIWCEDRGDVFYKQIRVGKSGKRFKMFKFRSMTMDSKEVPPSVLQKNDRRIKVTRIGRFLRATAMDELPQLINVLKGDMSFVGPRPLTPYETVALNPSMLAIRSSVRPALAGLAQICVNKFISNEKKIRYDLKYLKKQSLFYDLKIIFQSILITLTGKWELEKRRDFEKKA